MTRQKWGFQKPQKLVEWLLRIRNSTSFLYRAETINHSITLGPMILWLEIVPWDGSLLWCTEDATNKTFQRKILYFFFLRQLWFFEVRRLDRVRGSCKQKWWAFGVLSCSLLAETKLIVTPASNWSRPILGPSIRCGSVIHHFSSGIVPVPDPRI